MIQCDHPRVSFHIYIYIYFDDNNIITIYSFLKNLYNQCENAWYHWDCVGLTQQPSGQWFCPDCEFRPYEPIPLDDLMIEGFAMYSYPDQGLDDFTLSNPPFHWYVLSKSFLFYRLIFSSLSFN